MEVGQDGMIAEELAVDNDCQYEQYIDHKTNRR
jgi:hypothetical protein